MKSHPHARAGLTLVEVVVAMGLFTLGMLGLFAVTGQLRNVRDLSDNISQATLLAESKIENMRARGVSTIVDGSNTVGRYSMAWTVLTNSGFASKHVQVQVSWRDTRNLPHQVEVNTVVAK